MRKPVFTILLAVCLIACTSVRASAATHSIDSGYGVGTSNLTLFEGVAGKLSRGEHYVYWRENQYSFVFAYSDNLTLSDGIFSAETVTVVTYTTSSTYSGQATYTVSTEEAFVLDPGDYLVYSDLGNYPQLCGAEKEVKDYVQTVCVILCSFGLMWVFMRCRSALSDGFRFRA